MTDVRDRRLSTSEIGLVSLGTNVSDEGHLAVTQCGQHIPFKIDRTFTITAVCPNTIRGHHAHRRQSQFMICVSGEIDITIDDGRERKTYSMRGADRGLLVPPRIWCEQIYKTSGSVLLVLCDAPYDEGDYIRDYAAFKKLVAFPQMDATPDVSVRLNLGCGGRPKAGYINVDMDTLDQIRARYPNQKFEDGLVVRQYDIFDLPYDDNSVEEIRAEGLIEHLPFVDEPRFFEEVKRILRPGGVLYLSTVDFEAVAKQWLAAADDWKDFYRTDHEAILNQHWFGTYTYEPKNRWGYLAATIYGSQVGAGQFHTNCYSEGKLRAICDRINFEVVSVDRFQWKGNRDFMLGLTATKR